MNQELISNRNTAYNPQAPGVMVIDSVITLEGKCHLTIDRENLNGWHQCRLTHYLCHALHQNCLNKMTPTFFKEKIKVFADTPSIECPNCKTFVPLTPPCQNSLPGQLIVKGIVAPDGACYYELGEKNLDDWHYEKVCHFICQKMNEYAFETMQLPKIGGQNAQPNP